MGGIPGPCPLSVSRTSVPFVFFAFYYYYSVLRVSPTIRLGVSSTLFVDPLDAVVRTAQYGSVKASGDRELDRRWVAVFRFYRRAFEQRSLKATAVVQCFLPGAYVVSLHGQSFANAAPS